MADASSELSGEHRTQIERGHRYLRITNPLATSQGSKLHLTALLVIWLLGAAFALTALLLGKRILGPRIAHVLWIAAGIPVLWIYTRFAVGKEIITLREHTLTISRRPIPLGFRRRYSLAEARHFRVDTTGLRVTDARIRRNPLRWRGEQGMILFDYGLKPVRFGVGLTTAETRLILTVLRESGLIPPDQIAS